jgi:hypothetical protein
MASAHGRGAGAGAKNGPFGSAALTEDTSSIGLLIFSKRKEWNREKYLAGTRARTHGLSRVF